MKFKFKYSAKSADLEAENGATSEANLFKTQRTVPIIAYLTIQNFLVTTLIAALATGLYYTFSISANQKREDYMLSAIRNYSIIQQGYSCEEVTHHLDIFITQPHLSLQNSAEMFSTGFLDLEDWSQLNRWFFSQIQAYPTLSNIAFVEYPTSDVFGIAAYGDEDSKTYELQLSNTKANRLCPDALSVSGFCQTMSGNVTMYPTSNENVIDFAGVTTMIATPMFGSPDPTELGKYAMSEAPRDVVSWFPTIKVTNAEKGALGLSFVYPMWANETFLGTFKGEIDLKITHNLLHSLQEEATENTVIYVFQRNEVMVGTSTDDAITENDSFGAPQAVKLTEMTNPFISFTQNYIRSHYNGSISSAPADAQLNRKATDPSTGITYLFRFSALNPGNNLEWMVVVGAPEDDYTGPLISVQNDIFEQLQTSNRNVVLIIFSFQLFLMLATIVLLWYRVVKVLRTLVTGMNKAKEFDFSTISEGTLSTHPSFLSELYECEKAFFDMTKKFAQAFNKSRNVLHRQGTGGVSSTNKTSEQLTLSSSNLPLPIHKTCERLIPSPS